MFSFLESDIITADSYLEIAKINQDKMCYIKTDYLKNGKVPFMWREAMHPSHFKKIAIIGHSDHSVNDSDLDDFDLIFCINKNTDNPKVYGLPLGLPNDCDDLPILKIQGDKKMVVRISEESHSRTNIAYINFSENTFPSERGKIITLFSGYNWVKKSTPDQSYLGRIEYLRDLKKSKFCFCPRGNGIDTHRIWEALYMGSFPIVKRHYAHDFCSDLPIFFIDEWEEINEDLLVNKYNEFVSKKWNYEKLKVSFWEKYIKEISESKNITYK